jgi:hypothetical protein
MAVSGFLAGKVNEVPDREKEILIADTFVVTIHWLSPKERDWIGKQCIKQNRNGTDIDRDKHARAYTRKVVKGWKGLTLDVLTGPLKVAIFPEALAELKKVQEANNGELPFSQADSELIYLNALPDKYANRIKEAMDEWDEEDKAQEDSDLGNS